MEKHGPCHGHDGLYGVLGNPILVMSTNARQALVLVELGLVGSVFGGGEDSVVALVTLDANAHVKTEAFKAVFGGKCLVGGE